MSDISVIGSGFSGLSAACYAAKAGHSVTIFEKNLTIGGRARKFEEKGFMFDMGPSWYWMPDVFEKFFADFGKSPSDYYQLTKLSPAFQIIFRDEAPMVIPGEIDEIYTLFESIEKGSAFQLKKFLEEGKIKYDIAMADLIYKPALSWMEFASMDVIKGAMKTHILKSMREYIHTFFKDERLRTLMEFPVIFLGAMPDKIPALYSLMNYSAFSMGTWYPKGGMYEVIAGMEKLACSLGVTIETGKAVNKIEVINKTAKGLNINAHLHASNAIIASADYHHVEQNLLEEQNRNYKSSYWNKKVMAPSCLIFYLGVNKKIDKLLHHNLFFDSDFNLHASQIYNTPQWPDDPLFYVCCPSKTDDTVAPEGMENLFVLIPVAAGLTDENNLHEEYFSKIIQRLEKFCHTKIADHIIYKKTYSVSDFKTDYNAFKGNAYGLANTLNQTAVFKPSVRNHKIHNLFYTGQLTVPGPGVPPSLISGKISAEQAIHYLSKQKPKAHERTI